MKTFTKKKEKEIMLLSTQFLITQRVNPDVKRDIESCKLKLIDL